MRELASQGAEQGGNGSWLAKSKQRKVIDLPMVKELASLTSLPRKDPKNTARERAVLWKLEDSTIRRSFVQGPLNKDKGPV